MVVPMMRNRYTKKRKMQQSSTNGQVSCEILSYTSCLFNIELTFIAITCKSHYWVLQYMKKTQEELG
ncbi:Uncharacterised protein [Chlamydia trachomatis]|nr:Uncharacterised protein [Chlamydia trachomatis]